MIKKNIYILYPAGYSGNYLRWAITVSDVDKFPSTVKHSVNKTASLLYGPAGTSHLHERHPTHHNLKRTVAWIIRHKPTEPNIYLVNHDGMDIIIEEEIVRIAMFDEDAAFIVIHDSQYLCREYGIINCVTKWPAYLMSTRPSELNKWLSDTNDSSYQFDAYNCANDIVFRNNIVRYGENLFGKPCVSRPSLLNWISAVYNNWYYCRNLVNSHEVNEEQYIPHISMEGRVFDMLNLDIASDKLPSILKSFLEKSGISDNFDCSHFEKVHHEYIDAQPNLQWFSSVDAWEKTGEIDSYLRSHSVIQAQLILLMLRKSNIMYYSAKESTEWKLFYVNNRRPDWPDIMCKDSTPMDYWLLPEHVREYIQHHNTGINIPFDGPVTNTALLNWEKLTLDEINAAYQSGKQVS